MITVEQALSRIFSLIPPVTPQIVALGDADGRVMLHPAQATRDQPPFAASAMDGYAICAQDAQQGKRLIVIGESAAGHGLAKEVTTGFAARIFTGAPVPNGADTVVMQENVARDGDHITLNNAPDPGQNIRAQGGDFCIGDTLSAPRRLRPNDLALLASMNIAKVTVARRPVVALIATGDELVMPGEQPGPDQIIASNGFGLAALLRRAGVDVQVLPIARDNEVSLKAVFSLAKNADMVVTIGGASVGDHDIVGKVVADLGLEPSFYKILMRPGKPLMAGKLGKSIHLGLPGNPVSSMVCAHIFMLPALRAMQGLPPEPAPRLTANLATDVTANGPREHFMRAMVLDGKITPFVQQDSAMLGILSQANALLIRPANAPARQTGKSVQYVSI